MGRKVLSFASRYLRVPMAAAIVAVACPAADALADGQEPTGRIQSLDALLSGHLAGDPGILREALGSAADFRRLRLGNPKAVERWLGSFQRAKAVLLLDIAGRAAEVAPHFVRPVLGAGRRYVEAAPVARVPGMAPFVALWHRTAVGILQRGGVPFFEEEYLAAIGGAAGGGSLPADARLVLAHAIAQEQRCWTMRPELVRPSVNVRTLTDASGTAIRDPGRPSASEIERADRERSACLAEAVARFETAAADTDTRAEARVRGAWVLFQLGRLEEALDGLADVQSGDDRELQYWQALFTGRVLGSLGRHEEAEEAYRRALALCPAAQSAGIGLALTLSRLHRIGEADALARSLRAATSAHDPWWSYGNGDFRFVAEWVDRLREAGR